MKFHPPLILLALACLLFIAGLGYGVVMVGVPTQDASPAAASAEKRDVTVSMTIALGGAALGLLALIWLGAVAWIRTKRRSAG